MGHKSASVSTCDVPFGRDALLSESRRTDAYVTSQLLACGEAVLHIDSKERLCTATRHASFAGFVYGLRLESDNSCDCD